MADKFISIIKLMTPIITIILSGLQLAHVYIPSWLGVSILTIAAILFTIALVMEKHLKSN